MNGRILKIHELIVLYLEHIDLVRRQSMVEFFNSKFDMMHPVCSLTMLFLYFCEKTNSQVDNLKIRKACVHSWFPRFQFTGYWPGSFILWCCSAS